MYPWINSNVFMHDHLPDCNMLCLSVLSCMGCKHLPAHIDIADLAVLVVYANRFSLVSFPGFGCGAPGTERRRRLPSSSADDDILHVQCVCRYDLHVKV